MVGAAVADQHATAEGVTAAKLGFLPTPAISSRYSGDDGTVTSFTVRQPLWTGGRLTADVNRAINDDKAAMAKILERQNEVAKNTIEVWQGYIYSLSLQELYAGNLKQLAEFEEMMKRRVAQGVSARIELDLVTNRILQDQNSLQGAIEQQRIAEARLEQIVGQSISAPSGVSVAQMAQHAKQQSQNFGEMAFGPISENNPSVIRQRYEVDAARYEVKSRKSSQYPSIFIQYQNDYSHRDSEFDSGFTVGLSYDPGAGFSNLALARASEARVNSLIFSQEAARRTAMENIQTQYQQFISARDQELSLTAAVAGAQIVLNSYRRQFIAGRKSWLEVLNAVREQSQYEQQLRQIQAQMVASFYKLQVDFSLMPWQQQSMKYFQQPNNEFQLLNYAKQQVRRADSTPSYAYTDIKNYEPSYVTGSLPPIDEPMLREDSTTTAESTSDIHANGADPSVTVALDNVQNTQPNTQNSQTVSDATPKDAPVAQLSRAYRNISDEASQHTPILLPMPSVIVWHEIEVLKDDNMIKLPDESLSTP